MNNLDPNNLDSTCRNERALTCQSPHIVDTLIAERARHLRHNCLLWPLVRFALYPMLRYRAALEMANCIAPLSGHGVFEHVAERLNLQLDPIGTDQVPTRGACLIVGNHPTGIVDGIALYQSLKGRRTDLAFIANRDALRVAPRLEELVVPVEWVLDKRSFAKTRQMWRQTRAAFAAQRAVVMFPSGRVAQLAGGQLRDRPWNQAVIALAQRNRVPVVPVHIAARNSWIYYLFSRLSAELRDMTLFNELLNKRGRLFRLTFGPVIPYEELVGAPDEALARLRRYIEEDLPAGRPWTGRVS